MDRETFLMQLREQLARVSGVERQRILDYYGELIYDGIENGKTEQEVIEELGSAEQIAARAIEAYESEHKGGGGVKALKIIAMIFGIPFILIIAIPLAASAFVLYLAGWIVILSLCCAALAAAVSGIATFIASPWLVAQNPAGGLYRIGCAIFAMGVAIFLAIGVYHLARLYLRFTVFLTRWIARQCTRKPKIAAYEPAPVPPLPAAAAQEGESENE